MKRVKCKLSSAIVGVGFNLKRGHYSGELDDRGVVWVEVLATHRNLPGAERRTIGVSVARFDYVEDEAQQAAVVANGAHDKRAQIKAAIKAAEKARASRSKKAAGAA